MEIIVQDAVKYPYSFVHPSIMEDFERVVIDGYAEYVKKEYAPTLPDRLDLIDTFSDAFIELHNIGIHSMMREDYPEEFWQSFHEEQYNRYEEMAYNDPDNMTDPLMEDVFTCLRTHNIFCIVESFYWSPFSANVEYLGIADTINSPIQEVW